MKPNNVFSRILNILNADSVRQGDVIFKEAKDPEAAVSYQKQEFLVDAQLMSGNIIYNGMPQRPAWIIQGPTTTVVVLAEAEVNPVITALCHIYGHKETDYVAKMTLIFIDLKK